MIHSEFIEELGENLQLPRKKISQYSSLLVEMIRRAVEREDVEINNFGKFFKDGQKKRIAFTPDENFFKEINIK